MSSESITPRTAFSDDRSNRKINVNESAGRRLVAMEGSLVPEKIALSTAPTVRRKTRMAIRVVVNRLNAATASIAHVKMENT